MEKSNIETWKQCFRVERKHGNNFLNIFEPDDDDNVRFIMAFGTADFIYDLDDRFGVEGVYVCYVAKSKETAVEEKKHSFKEFLITSGKSEDSFYFYMIDVHIDKKLDFCDIRGMLNARGRYSKIYDGSNYNESQRFAAEIYNDDVPGIIYDSVRHDGGECLALFAKDTLTGFILGEIVIHWDGKELNVT